MPDPRAVVGPPDLPEPDPQRTPLDAAALRAEVVRPGGRWRELRLVARTTSTNADAVAAARAGAADGLVIVAEHQTAGRGRAGRQWSSPPRAGLAVSVLLRPTGVPAARRGLLPLLAGVAVVTAVRRHAGLPATVTPELKWPNDLLLRTADGAAAGAGPAEGKCGGILAEANGDAVVVGIGVNVSQRAGELPPVAAGAAPPTSLALAGAAAPDRRRLLVGLLAALDDGYRRWAAAGGDPVASGLRTEYRRSCGTLGRPVRLLLPDGTTCHGTAERVDAAGRLVVATPAGERVFAAGDVAHLRRPH